MVTNHRTSTRRKYASCVFEITFHTAPGGHGGRFRGLATRGLATNVS
jgi:hypothetical protein